MKWMIDNKNVITSTIGFILTVSVTVLGLTQTYSISMPSYISVSMVFINAIGLGIQGLLIGKYPDKRVSRTRTK